MKSLNQKRIKDVFENSLKNVRDGKKPNISGNMRKQGYSESSSKALKVKETKTWKELLNKIDDSKVLNMLDEIVEDKSDKRARIEAGKEIMKLKDRYPRDKSKLVGLYERLDDIEET